MTANLLETLTPGDLSTVGETVATHLAFDPMVVWNHRAKASRRPGAQVMPDTAAPEHQR